MEPDRKWFGGRRSLWNDVIKQPKSEMIWLPTPCRNKLLQIFPIFPLLTFCFRGLNGPEVCATFGKGSSSAERLETGNRTTAKFLPCNFLDGKKFVEPLWKTAVNVTLFVLTLSQELLLQSRTRWSTAWSSPSGPSRFFMCRWVLSRLHPSVCPRLN